MKLEEIKKVYIDLRQPKFLELHQVRFKLTTHCAYLSVVLEQCPSFLPVTVVDEQEVNLVGDCLPQISLLYTALSIPTIMYSE